MPGFNGVTPGVQQRQPVVAQDPKAEANQGTAARNARVSYLGSTTSLGDGAGHCATTPVTFGLCARDPEKHGFGLTGPVVPRGRGGAEATV